MPLSKDQCKICGCLMNVQGKVLSQDCGNHCWGCRGELEAQKGFEPSIAVVLDEWRRGLRPDWYPSTLTLNPTFADLRETPLHLVIGAQWDSYYAQMSPYLSNARSDIRSMAVERLMMAVFRSDARHRKTGDWAAWLLTKIEMAHSQHSDVLPEFLRGLRWHGDNDDFRSVLLPWLDKLEAQKQEGVDPGLIRGARILIAPQLEDEAQQMAEWTVNLDDPSDWVRGCAARSLASLGDDDDGQQLIAVISAHEIVRPGVAGPFAGEFYAGLSYGPWGDATRMSEWMMDLLERRQGTVPDSDAMPFNDIEFHLHELCSTSPDMMQRMIDGGFIHLALMTATEERIAIEGVRPILEQLTRVSCEQIATAAANHLTQHYTLKA